MSYLVSQMPLWLILGIETICITVLIVEINKHKGHLSRALTLLAIAIGFMMIFTVTSNTNLPWSINWALIALFFLFLFTFLVDIFIFIYNTKLESGKKRKTATVAFCIFVGYFLFLVIGITIKVLQKI